MLKAIFFDLDHTLYDRFETMKKILPIAYIRLRDLLAENLPYEKFRDVMIEAERENNYSGWTKRAEYMFSCGLFRKMPDAGEVRRLTYECFMLDAVHYPYTEGLLKKLREKGYILGIITNGEDYIQRGKVEKLHFSEFFDIIYFCGDDNIQKPAPEPFLRACAMAEAAPDQCLYVGDNPKNDVYGAKAAGLETVWVATCGPWRYDEYPRADFEIENIGCLIDILPDIERNMAEKQKKSRESVDKQSTF